MMYNNNTVDWLLTFVPTLDVISLKHILKYPSIKKINILTGKEINGSMILTFKNPNYNSKIENEEITSRELQSWFDQTNSHCTLRETAETVICNLKSTEILHKTEEINNEPYMISVVVALQIYFQSLYLRQHDLDKNCRDLSINPNSLENIRSYQRTIINMIKVKPI